MSMLVLLLCGCLVTLLWPKYSFRAASIAVDLFKCHVHNVHLRRVRADRPEKEVSQNTSAFFIY